MIAMECPMSLKFRIIATVVASALTVSCKMRSGSESSAAKSSDALKDKPWAICGAASGSPFFETEIGPENGSNAVVFRYTTSKDRTESSYSKVSGIWENAAERDPYIRIYAFGPYKLMLTLERTTAGFYPATLEESGATDHDILHLMCAIP